MNRNLKGRLSSLLFNFQGSVFSLRCDSFNIISHLFFFVNTFFKLFQVFSWLDFLLSEMQLLYHITSLRFCQVLFSTFFKVFSHSLPFLSSFLIGQLYHITTFNSLCQGVFRHFLFSVKNNLFLSRFLKQSDNHEYKNESAHPERYALSF